MAAGNAYINTNDRNGQKRDIFVATVAAAGALNGAVEGIVSLPPSGADGISAGNGWELLKADIAVGVNTTWTDGVITVSVEKNTDGGTSAFTTAPAIGDGAGTGRRSTAVDTTDVTAAVIKTDGGEDFADTDVAFVTLSESGSAGGGADPSDVSVRLVFGRKQDFDPNF